VPPTLYSSVVLFLDSHLNLQGIGSVSIEFYPNAKDVKKKILVTFEIKEKVKKILIAFVVKEEVEEL